MTRTHVAYRVIYDYCYPCLDDIFVSLYLNHLLNLNYRFCKKIGDIIEAKSQAYRRRTFTQAQWSGINFHK